MIDRISKHIRSESFQNIYIKTRNLIQGKLDRKIFYLHLPKCGGTSLNKALQSFYVSWSIWDENTVAGLNSAASWQVAEHLEQSTFLPTIVDDSSVLVFRESLLLYYMAQNSIRYVTGHFPYSEIAYTSYSDTFDFITVMRDPVDRWISSYFYNRYRQKQSYRKLEMEFDDYLMSEFGQSQGYEYSKFLSGLHGRENFMSRVSVEAAKENLHKFKLIGFLDQMNVFFAQFEREYQVQLKMNSLNARPKSEVYELTANQLDKIKEICAADIEIYEYARSIQA